MGRKLRAIDECAVRGPLSGLALLATLITSAILPSAARAGGYDTPLLYSARHIGMGGTAVSFVNDASAIFHNPAGLARLQGRANILGDFSPTFVNLQTSPAAEAINHGSELIFAPFFFVGGAYKFEIDEDIDVAVGAAVYPSASAAATYRYDVDFGSGGGVQTIEDSTTLVFLEFSPAVAVRLPAGVTLGASYRVTSVSLDRSRGGGDAPVLISLAPSGLNVAGFRFGAQWEAIENHLSFGVQYRHQTNTEVTADTGQLRLGGTVNDLFAVETDFTLPSRLSWGVRGDFENLGVAVDMEYGFNSQNTSAPVSARGSASETAPRVAFANVFDWSDALTVRVGSELDLPLDGGAYVLTPRIGYVFDDKTTNASYPSAFGTPPTATHSLTAGVGFDGGPWEINLAYAHRFGATTVPPIPAGSKSCAFCSQPGNYTLSLHGVYVDASYDFD